MKIKNLFFVLVFSLIFSGTAFAFDHLPNEVDSIFNGLDNGYDHLILDKRHGVWVQRDEIRKVVGYDVPFVEYPSEYGGVSVPFRLVAELIGWTVEWDSETRSVYARTRGDESKGIAIKIIDGEPPTIVANRTMIPLEIAVEYLAWDHGKIKVILQTKDFLVLRI